MAKKIKIEEEVQAPVFLKQTIESNLNMFRLIGDVVALYTAELGNTALGFTEVFMNENEEKSSEEDENKTSK